MFFPKKNLIMPQSVKICHYKNVASYFACESDTHLWFEACSMQMEALTKTTVCNGAWSMQCPGQGETPDCWLHAPPTHPSSLLTAHPSHCTPSSLLSAQPSSFLTAHHCLSVLTDQLSPLITTYPIHCSLLTLRSTHLSSLLTCH